MLVEYRTKVQSLYDIFNQVHSDLKLHFARPQQHSKVVYDNEINDVALKLIFLRNLKSHGINIQGYKLKEIISKILTKTKNNSLLDILNDFITN